MPGRTGKDPCSIEVAGECGTDSSSRFEYGEVWAKFPARIISPIAFRLGRSLRARVGDSGSVGDREQWDAEFYKRFGYPTLYTLGAVGRGRRQIQVLVRRDDCCFGEAQHDTGAVGKGYEAAVREYELKVQHAVAATGEGHFEVVIDNSATSHQVSLQTLRGVLLPGLRPRP